MGAQIVGFVNHKRWKVIQDFFARVIGAGVRVVDVTGISLTSLSNPHRYCFEVISSAAKGFVSCKECLLFSPQPDTMKNFLSAPEYFLDNPFNIFYNTCPFHINYLLIPVQAPRQEEGCAYIVVGPVILGKRKSYPEYFNLSRDLELDVNSVIESVENIRVYSFEGIESLARLFQETANCIAELTAEQEHPQEPPGAPLNEREKRPFYIDKILQAFFETAIEGIEAERGSLMMYDEQSKTLSIEMARGITDDIIRATKLPYGEGIAGWAAKTDEVVFIDDKFKSPELLEKLHQPCLRASLVFPVKNGKKIFGVLNLATSSKRHKFNRENIASIARLVKMVDTVLS